jgi:hypothetical protein
MLCNRPNEFGQVQKQERQGKPPFISRVDPKDKIGLNPTKKIVVVPKKKKDANSILTRHKRYLKMLQEKKLIEKLEKENEETKKAEKTKKFKETTAMQRKKINNLKTEKEGEAHAEPAETQPVLAPIPPKEESKVVGKLTEANLKKNEEQYYGAGKAKKSSKQKPAWAKTEQQLKREQEDEIDDLIEFAYELDYEKYMEDLEVRQALALIKERVDEIKKDNEWRTNVAKEWNDLEQANPNEGYNKRQDDDNKSVASIRTSITGRSRMSKMSKKSELMDEIKREDKQKEDWDTSTNADRQKKTVEERLASKLADQILENNPNLKGVHSKVSMKRMLEKEAAKQLIENDGGAYAGPKVATLKDHEMNKNVEASNLPYLHKNPAI